MAIQAPAVFSALSLVAAGVVVGLQGPFKGSLFTGRFKAEAAESSGNKKIDGTTIGTANCFLDPTAPLTPDHGSERCRAMPNADHPTLYFEGDSHAHALMALAQQILQEGSHNVSLFARGGCLLLTSLPGRAAGRMMTDTSSAERMIVPGQSI